MTETTPQTAPQNKTGADDAPNAGGSSLDLVTRALGAAKRAIGIGKNAPQNPDASPLQNDNTAPEVEGEARSEGAERKVDPPAAKKPEVKLPDVDPNDPVQVAVNKAMQPLTDYIMELEGKLETRESQRRGEDARDAFMRTYMPDFPPDLIRQLLPASEDPKALGAAAKKIGDGFRYFMDKAVKSGRLRWVDVGGDAGGNGPLNFVGPDKRTPQELVTAGLKNAPQVDSQKRGTDPRMKDQ